MLGRSRNVLSRLPPGPVRVAEIGVFCGEMSAELLSRPDLFLYMVDSWAPEEKQPESYRATRDSHAHVPLAMQLSYMHQAIAATNFAADRRKILHMRSERAVGEIEPASLDCVFFDGDHSFEGLTADVEAWLPLVRPGGLLSGHDYCEGYGPDERYDFKVINAVDAAVARYGWTLDLADDSCWFVRIP